MREPNRIAFIQWVGSRDKNADYCSAVFCMASIKETIVAKEHCRELDCTVFFTDIRAFGKGYEDYYNRAKELGVRFIRSRPSSIKDEPGTDSLLIRYQNHENKIVDEIFDLVVLSIGFFSRP